MNKLAFQTLEFDKILDKLASYTESEAVKDTILNLMPFSTLSDAVAAQRETTEAVNTCFRIGNPPVNLGVNDVTACVKRSDIGGVLNPKDLMSVARVLYVARRMKAYLSDCAEDAQILRSLSGSLMTAKLLEDEINTVILSETEIADDASQDLFAIRRKMKALNAPLKHVHIMQRMKITAALIIF